MGRLLIGAVLLLSEQVALAADIRMARAPDGGQVVVVSGEIDLDDDEKFARVASTLGDASVWLVSPGGSTFAAVHIGTAIRLRQWRTVVPQGATCASACALIWMAGTQRSVGTGGRVGFHVSYIVRNGQPMEAGAGNALVGAYLNKLGLRDSAVLYATTSPPTESSWLTAVDARAVGINALFNTSETLPPSDQLSPGTSVQPAMAATALSGGPTLLTENQMMANLYRGFPGSVVLDGQQVCAGVQCSISFKKKDGWTGQDGKPRQMVVGVVEQENGSHAATAVLGIGVYRWDYVTWVPEAVVPAVVGVGAWGTYRDNIDILHFPGFDPLLLVADSGFHQGISDESRSIVTRVFGTFRSVLQVDASHGTGGNCDPREAACQKKIQAEDFASTVTVEASSKGGIDVTQRFSTGSRTAPKSWHVDESGKVQPGPENAPPSAQLVATLASPSFNEGMADRRRYEAWFSAQGPDVKEGAVFWAEQRSLRTPQSCAAAKPTNASWTSGCLQARQMLTPFDERRKADPDYRRGWNSL